MEKILILSLMIITIIQSSRNFAMGDRALIEKTCKATPLYNLCMSTLLSDPKSTTADVTGLALIVVVKTNATATSILKRIKVLTRTSPDLAPALTECKSNYEAVVIGDVPPAVDALNFGNPKFAENGMADVAVFEAPSCEDALAKLKSHALTNMNNAARDLAVVARAIIRLLL